MSSSSSYAALLLAFSCLMELSTDLCPVCQLKCLTIPKRCSGFHTPEHVGLFYQQVSALNNHPFFEKKLTEANLISAQTTIMKITAYVQAFAGVQTLQSNSSLRVLPLPIKKSVLARPAPIVPSQRQCTQSVSTSSV